MNKTRLVVFAMFILSILLTSSHTNVLRSFQNPSSPTTTTVATEFTTIEATESAATANFNLTGKYLKYWAWKNVKPLP